MLLGFAGVVFFRQCVASTAVETTHFLYASEAESFTPDDGNRRLCYLDLAGMASLTHMDGSTTAIAGSEGLNRPNLLLPGIFVGLLGNAMGPYLGFAVAGRLRAYCMEYTIG
jgi:hypothetical protein